MCYDDSLVKEVNTLQNELFGEIVIPNRRCIRQYTGEKLCLEYLLSQNVAGELQRLKEAEQEMIRTADTDMDEPYSDSLFDDNGFDEGFDEEEDDQTTPAVVISSFLGNRQLEQALAGDLPLIDPFEVSSLISTM